MKKAFDTLKLELSRAMNALTFAHTGEMLPLTQKSRVLAGNSYPKAIDNSMYEGSTSTVSTDKERVRKRLVLALNSSIQPGVLRYAVDAAVRFDAQLDILSNFTQAQIKQEMGQILGDFADDWNLVSVSGDLMSAIAEYTNQHPEVMFIVTSDRDSLTERYVATRSVKSVTSIPWVLVADELCAA